MLSLSTYSHFGDDHELKDLDPTPRGNQEQWRFTPSLLDPNSFAFSTRRASAWALVLRCQCQPQRVPSMPAMLPMHRCRPSLLKALLLICSTILIRSLFSTTNSSNRSILRLLHLTSSCTSRHLLRPSVTLTMRIPSQMTCVWTLKWPSALRSCRSKDHLWKQCFESHYHRRRWKSKPSVLHY